MDLIDIIYIIPEIFLIFMSMVLLIAGAHMQNSFTLPVNRLAVLSLAITTFLLSKVPLADYNSFHGMISSNVFTIFAKMLLAFAAAMVILVSMDYARNKGSFFEYPVLILLAVTGMMVMVSANDLITLYLGLEMQSLCLYVLAASNRDSVKSSEAGLKYFVLGALSSGIFLYGASLVYGFTGTTNFTSLSKIYQFLAESQNSLPIGVIVGMVMIIIAICFKISAVPFHMWTPDVYEGSPTPVTTFFAAVPKVAGVMLFIRLLLEAFGGLIDQWRQIIIFVSVASMLLGAVAAIRQRNIKRLLAYSSIGHIGYVLIGIVAGDAKGVQAALIYMMIYVTMTVGAFGCIILMKKNDQQFEDIKSLAGLGKTNPLFAFVFSVFLFSMAGIPPLAGFFAKFAIFMAAVNAELYTLAVIGVLASVIGAFYYLNIVKIMYFDEGGKKMEARATYAMKIILGIVCVFNLIFFIFPSILFEIAKIATSGIIS